MTDPAQRIAAAVGREMFARDNAAHALGIELREIRPGFARMEMTVRADMLNGHGFCHGGLIFTLADATFAYACNAYNRVTVAQHCSISYLAPARRGDVLIATAAEHHRAGRTGIYDIHIADRTGNRVAVFRGHSYQLAGEVVANLGTAS